MRAQSGSTPPRCRTAALASPGWERASLLLHEIGHDAAANHLSGAAAQAHCVDSNILQRDIMCEAGLKGRLMTDPTCFAFYTGLNNYHDFNEVNGGP